MRIVQDTRSIYIIYNKELRRTKIGYSVNPVERIRTLQMQAGCDMKLIYHTRPVYNYTSLEAGMHEYFRDSRFLGEWFKIHFKRPLEVLKNMVGGYEVCKIITMFDNGLNPTEIAHKLDVSRSGVVKYLLSRGYLIKSRPIKVKKKKMKRIKKPPSQLSKYKSFMNAIKNKGNISSNQLQLMVDKNNAKRKKK